MIDRPHDKQFTPFKTRSTRLQSIFLLFCSALIISALPVSFVLNDLKFAFAYFLGSIITFSVLIWSHRGFDLNFPWWFEISSKLTEACAWPVLLVKGVIKLTFKKL